MSPALMAGVSAIAAAHLAAYYRGGVALAGVLKPMPILLLAAVVWQQGLHPYAGLVAAGLVVSAVGDVSLVFASGFLAGLSAFLVAHLIYIWALLSDGIQVGPVSMGVGVVLGGVAATMVRVLWAHLRRVRPAVILYMMVLSLMAWCAVQRATGTAPPPGATWAALGAGTFLVSDGLLSVNRFVRPFAGAHGAVMATYYLAQALIAASALSG